MPFASWLADCTPRRLVTSDDVVWLPCLETLLCPRRQLRPHNPGRSAAAAAANGLSLRRAAARRGLPSANRGCCCLQLALGLAFIVRYSCSLLEAGFILLWSSWTCPPAQGAGTTPNRPQIICFARHVSSLKLGVCEGSSQAASNQPAHCSQPGCQICELTAGSKRGPEGAKLGWGQQATTAPCQSRSGGTAS